MGYYIVHDAGRVDGKPVRIGKSPSSFGETAVAADRLTVAEDGDVISFYLRGEDGLWTFVQYSRDQVWRDQRGVWQIKDQQQPFYAGRASGPPPPTAKLCQSLSHALDAAAKTPLHR